MFFTTSTWSPYGVTHIIEPPCMEKEGTSGSAEEFVQLRWEQCDDDGHGPDGRHPSRERDRFRAPDGNGAHRPTAPWKGDLGGLFERVHLDQPSVAVGPNPAGYPGEDRLP